jgi:Lon-like ATP-dependent protease
MLTQREWREGYLAERMQDEILLEQILIETEGEQVGQINALSVVEFPGHPRAFGEPSRISCVVHIGDGEFNDIERKAELGGNIHAKGMMIMQSFLMAELELEQQIPFSASLTFEQSYSEVDGDSASMAELCALISALADVLSARVSLSPVRWISLVAPSLLAGSTKRSKASLLSVRLVVWTATRG